jgi:phosphatidylethanolamine/phosphatidyl-N-methylethanolamine N-methyltransferase
VGWLLLAAELSPAQPRAVIEQSACRGSTRKKAGEERAGLKRLAWRCRSYSRLYSGEAEQMSTAIVDNQFVVDVYARLAKIYDWVFGRPLQSGRVAAMRQLGLHAGETVLEVGIGTGISASLYPRGCDVVGIDLSEPMLERAAQRLQDEHIRNVRLLRMDAAHLDFPDESFDAVYAPYLISAVPDPVMVAREMGRVCRTNGRIVFVNHFLSGSAPIAWLERAIAPLAIHCGFRSDLELRTLLRDAALDPISIEKVNHPRLWSLVTCRKKAP